MSLRRELRDEGDKWLGIGVSQKKTTMEELRSEQQIDLKKLKNEIVSGLWKPYQKQIYNPDEIQMLVQEDLTRTK